VTETVSYGAGLSYQIDEITSFSADLSYTTIDETIFDFTTTENEGWAYDIGVQRQMRATAPSAPPSRRSSTRPRRGP
jgi:hypothetical protein